MFEWSGLTQAMLYNIYTDLENPYPTVAAYCAIGLNELLSRVVFSKCLYKEHVSGGNLTYSRFFSQDDSIYQPDQLDLM